MVQDTRQDTRQAVAEAIRERTGEDVGEMLHDACLAQYEALDEAEKRVRIERAVERVQLWGDLRALSEEARSEARSTLETIRKLMENPNVLAVTSEFMDDVARLEAMADPEEFCSSCPLLSESEVGANG